MIYNLEFTATALKEWKKLDKSVKIPFKKKLQACLLSPKIPKNKLSGFENLYKIKLRSAGYRLVYEVIDETVAVTVITLGRRDEIYQNLLR